MKHLFFLLFYVTSLWSYPYQAKDFSHLINSKDFDPSLIKMHITLYQGYVKNCNLLQELISNLEKKHATSSYEYGAIKRRFGWEFDGMRLHELYFSNLGGNGEFEKNSSLLQAIKKQFSSIEQWKSDFKATALIRGIGWVILYFDPQNRSLYNVWINEHDVGHLATGIPILVLDVWEHAYLTQFGLDRGKYVDIFFQNIDWKEVENRYSEAIGSYALGGKSLQPIEPR